MPLLPHPAYAAGMERDVGPRWAPLVPPPRLILFDLDDTLCDYAAARDLRLRRAFAPALARLGGESPGLLERMIADSLAMHLHGADHFGELFQRYGIDEPALAEAAAAWYRTNRFYGLRLFADAMPLLTRLRQASPRRHIGIVTNGPAEVQRPKVQLLAVERLVDFILISGELGVAKPEPAIYVEALRQGGVETGAVVFIGDSVEDDIGGARAAGIAPIWLNRERRAWPGPGPAPAYIAASLAELASLLLGEERREDNDSPPRP